MEIHLGGYEMAKTAYTLFPPSLAFLLAPLMVSVINKVKAVSAGRKGPPVLQPYYDLIRLLKKGAIYSETTTWVFRAGPVVSLACILVALWMVPLGSNPAPLAFPGDFILLAYLFGLVRFFTVLAALDTGSSFEGMGASREVTFSALAEPVLFLGLATIARLTGHLSLTGMFSALPRHDWHSAAPLLLLVAAALFVVFLAEKSRLPVDDPNTHLELTMIHEVMVLDHSGPDFGGILYGSALKLWILGSILAGILVPVHSGNPLLNLVIPVLCILALAVSVGVIESSMARLRLLRVPQLLTGAAGLAVLALILVLR